VDSKKLGPIVRISAKAGSEQPMVHRRRCFGLEGDDPVDAIRPEDRELAFIDSAEVDQAAAPSTGTSQGNLVDGSNTGPILVLEQHDRLAGHRCVQSKAGEVNQLCCCRLRIRNQGLRLRIHSMIEADGM
jgi:hypothetical protein